jgi:DNA adenine methylase
VTGLDAEHYLRTVLPTVSSPFLYLDPPYYGKGRRLYEDFYEHDDHARIAELVQRLDQPWIVSYDARAEIETLYNRVRRVSYGLNYTARHRFVGSEVMFLGPRLAIPEVSSPPT